MENEKIKNLKESCEWMEKVSMEGITKKKEPFFVNSLSVVYECKAFLSIFLDKNFLIARNYYSLAAQAELFAFYNSGIPLESNIGSVCCFLLSDNQELYNIFKSIELNEDLKFQLPHQFYTFSQAVLNNDLAKMEVYSQLFIKTSQKGNKKYLPIGYVLEGIWKMDENVIQEHLSSLFNTIKGRATLPQDEFFALDVSAVLKLAWLRGLEIQPLNDMVPIEILKIQPLEEYQTYDFFDKKYFRRPFGLGYWGKFS